MSKDLQRLKSIGAQKICEDTHIPLSYVQNVIHESFEGLTKVQFLGFISILEREYQLNLSVLKTKGVNYFDEEKISDEKVFKFPEKRTNFTGLYIVIVLIIFSLAIYKSLDYNKVNLNPKSIDNNTIIDAQEKISITKKNKVNVEFSSDINITQELNNTVERNSSNEITNVLEIEEVTVKKEIIVKKPVQIIVKKSLPLVIKPRSKVWIGYINLTDKEKHQATVKHNLTLDSSKEWLIVTGHGNINIVLNGETKKYFAPKSVRYLYKNGTLKKLSVKEFKKLNNGHLW